MPKIKPLKYDPCCGTHINQACKEAAALAKENGRIVNFNFNGVKLSASPGKPASTLNWEYNMEMNRLAHTPEAVRKRKEWEAESAREVAETQVKADRLMGKLPQVVGNLTELMAWLKEYTPCADLIGVKAGNEQLLMSLTEAGYEVGWGVGKPKEFFVKAENVGRWVVGQVMDCLKRGMGPHPITTKFCDDYKALLK
jgi:hypothetical protein